MKCLNLIKEKIKELKLYRIKNRPMKISGIDKDFVDVINSLSKGGFRPFASCDGVEANHINGNQAQRAYISFLESDNIECLMAAFLRDDETFSVSLQNQTYSKPISLYGNLIHGNRFSVMFDNKTGDYTSYFQKIVQGVINKSIQISDEEIKVVRELNLALSQDKKSDLCFDVELNGYYQPYMNKPGKTHSLKVSTKGDVGYYKDMRQLLEILAKQKGVKISQAGYGQEFIEDEFGVCPDDAGCEIYFSRENLAKIPEMITEIRNIGRSLQKHKVVEQEYERDNDSKEIDVEI